MASMRLTVVDHELTEVDARIEGSADDIRSIELLALFDDHDVSVRLKNAVAGAMARSALPFKTVGQYADAGAMAQTIMLRHVRNFGRKSARELDALVRHLFAVPAGGELMPTSVAPALDRTALVELFTGETLAALIADEFLSVRLSNALSQPALRNRSFADVLENFELTIATILRQPNCGRRSANEFRQFCQRHIRSRLISHGYGDTEPLIAWLLGGAAPCSAEYLAGAQRAVGSENALVDPLRPPEHGTLTARLEWLLGELDERARSILCRRNAIGQDRCETLEEIGSDMSVTRERIRQIESKSLKRIRIRVRRAPIAGLLRSEGAALWSVLSGNADFLRRGDSYEWRKLLPPYFRLALDIEERTIESLLDEIAQIFPHGWLASHIDAAPIEAAAKAIQAEQDLPLPQPLVRIVGGDLDAAQAAAVLILGQPVRYGYIMPPRIGVRLTRLVRLHALLAGKDEATPLEILVHYYRGLFEDDPCTERDAEIVMDAAPHMFLEIAEGSWSAIGIGGTSFPTFEPGAEVVEQGFEEPGTIAHSLQVTLDARGPTRLVELLDDADDILPDGRSINSIGPVLLTRRELFVRALPGVYALPRHIPEYRAAMAECWPVLFNDYQARMYAIARYAGEPRNIFPLWSSHVEYEFCRWARHSGGPGILSSLLAVAVIDDWATSPDIAIEWRRIQRQEGRFELGGSLRHAVAYERPALDRVFASCRHAATSGQFNWVAGNRLTGRRIDSHAGAGLVALLLRLGAVEEISHEGFRWQRQHRATERAAEIAAQLDEAFSRTGDLTNWESPIGRDLALLASHSEVDDWVDDAALAAMLSRAAQSPIVDPEDDDPLAQLLAAQRRARESERREATLDWLLDD